MQAVWITLIICSTILLYELMNDITMRIDETTRRENRELKATIKELKTELNQSKEKTRR